MIKDDRCRGIVLMVAGIMVRASCGFADEPSRASSALSQVRRASPDVFTLEVEIDLPVILLAQGQGNTTRVVRVTVGKDMTAIVWKALQLPPPKYFPPDRHSYQPIDYDDEGSLILWMSSEGATICDPRIHEEYSEVTGFRVAPDGRVVRADQDPGVSLYRYRPTYSNTDGLAMLRTIRRALGRPSGDDFAALEAEESKPDGTHELRVSGQSSPYSGLGVWNLVVDPANGHLVRSASFGPRGGPPRTQFRSEGTRRFGNVTLAARGEYIHPPQHIWVRLVSFSPTLDNELIKEARKVIARAQTRMVQVFDYRLDPTHPKVKLVPAGELDKDK